MFNLNGWESSLDNSLSNRGWIASGPGDLEEFNLLKTLNISSSVITISLSTLLKSAWKSGIGSSPSSTNTELKKLFNKLDFSESVSVKVKSSLIRLEMPSLCLVLDEVYWNRALIFVLAFLAICNSFSLLFFKTSLLTIFLK